MVAVGLPLFSCSVSALLDIHDIPTKKTIKLFLYSKPTWYLERVSHGKINEKKQEKNGRLVSHCEVDTSTEDGEWRRRTFYQILPIDSRVGGAL